MVECNFCTIVRRIWLCSRLDLLRRSPTTILLVVTRRENALKCIAIFLNLHCETSFMKDYVRVTAPVGIFIFVQSESEGGSN